MAGRSRSHKSKKGPRSSKRPTHGRNRDSRQPDLVTAVRRALRDPNPLSLLGYVSTLLSVTDPRRQHPFAPSESESPSRDDLVGMFIDVSTPETSALLAVIAELAGGDELLRTRIRRELTARPRIEPAWLAELSEAETYRAVRMSHILGDGDNIMLGTRLPGGQEFTSIVYIDHNMGTLVKDAFALPESIESIVAGYRHMTDDPDTRWDDVELADARACVDAAIELAAITIPPFESETWPGSRPLVEWITRGLPEGGSGYQRPPWTTQQLAEVADRFFASSYGAQLSDRDHGGLLDSILRFGTECGPGNPLRWSPVRVELLLADWIPRKVVAPADHLALVPNLLRAFIRFAHAALKLRSALTDESLTAVDSWEPSYLETVGASRPEGPDALFASLGVGGDDVMCCDDQGRVTVNGVALSEKSYLAKGEKPSLIDFDVPVPPGYIWVQGDNRSNSADSRVHLGDPGGGLIPVEDVVGKVFMVVWPWDHAKLVERPATFDSVDAE